ncbi:MULTISPECIES: lipopolysaccharide transport periplasmic protein LptA [Pseudoxanthomonas]|jgi:lipopolysaccharide export system protein LptA|uniref:Lipopolysaccharide export system protein LptA n=1 Tax=Pseudoxanthomonas winnipegensis TaxID=2480810 RepID=A0A4Q8LWH1_9GAMM|nr:MULTISPECIES: lipopolysaccharide transport periplasmic protein LptA [Pseudoxanthomonas]MDQ1118506.1 lipopolysaccharide export system protein LptA [Pseudoxanthomonas winnipegensis]MDQ1131691.1 lipopolysaccharide export system protein LptA [Pseudoxanthomonas winnipegensis]MDR6138291.1 lipopolysaccharide export system protein LptA [Pseudoxanthomonas sp. SORGH_AS_0997]RZZ86667.1 lipopolysaccharide transport periplasmic protein LptA [Pseudoxanthomonas winnipegensis]TAA08133.1 lipopolysaccharide 
MCPNPRNKTGLAALAAACLLVVAGGALAKKSDRDQPMTIDSDTNDISFADDGVSTLTGNVVIVQGTLEVHADKGLIYRKAGEVSRGVFTGTKTKQPTLHQINDDGTPIDATADRIDYDITNNIITLTGNYKITSPRGTNAGEKMVYNTVTGNMQSGGDGNRVRTVIQPKNKAPAAGAAPAPAKPGTK